MGSKGGSDTPYYRYQDELYATQADIARGMYNQYAHYAPNTLYNMASMVDDANSGAYEQRLYDRMRNEAFANSAAANAMERQATERQLAGMGVNPNDPRYAAQLRNVDLGNTARLAGGLNAVAYDAKQQGENMAWSKTHDFYNTLAGMPTTSTASLASAASGYGQMAQQQNQNSAANAAGFGKYGQQTADALFGQSKADGGIIRGLHGRGGIPMAYGGLVPISSGSPYQLPAVGGRSSKVKKPSRTSQVLDALGMYAAPIAARAAGEWVNKTFINPKPEATTPPEKVDFMQANNAAVADAKRTADMQQSLEARLQGGDSAVPRTVDGVNTDAVADAVMQVTPPPTSSVVLPDVMLWPAVAPVAAANGGLIGPRAGQRLAFGGLAGNNYQSVAGDGYGIAPVVARNTGSNYKPPKGMGGWDTFLAPIQGHLADKSFGKFGESGYHSEPERDEVWGKSDTAAPTNALDAVDRLKGLAGPRQRRKDISKGGEIDGPGTETSDDVPVMASDGEYMLNAETVKLVGIDFLDRLNELGLDMRRRDEAAKRGRKMKSGGMVGKRRRSKK